MARSRRVKRQRGRGPRINPVKRPPRGPGYGPAGNVDLGPCDPTDPNSGCYSGEFGMGWGEKICFYDPSFTDWYSNAQACHTDSSCVTCLEAKHLCPGCGIKGHQYALEQYCNITNHGLVDFGTGPETGDNNHPHYYGCWPDTAPNSCGYSGGHSWAQWVICGGEPFSTDPGLQRGGRVRRQQGGNGNNLPKPWSDD